MNGMAAINQDFSIEVNYDPSLFVGVTIYDDSGSSPVQLMPVGNVNGIMPMLNVIDTLYRLKFNSSLVKSYIFRKAVYTDNTYTALNTNYSRASEAVQVVDMAALVLNAPIENYQIPGSVGAAIALGSAVRITSQLNVVIDDSCIQGNTCQVQVPCPIQIVQGDNNVPMVFTLTYKSTGRPVDLTSATEITTNYLESDGVTVLTHKLSLSELTLVGPGNYGTFQDMLSNTETKLLNPGNNPIIITYTIAGVEKILVLQGALTVVEPPFPIS